MGRKNIVFLYSEMGDYFFSCINEFTNTHSYRAHIIHQKPKGEAPFRWESTNSIIFYDRENFSKKNIIEFLRNLQPSGVYVVNWLDKSYIYALHRYKKKYDPDLVVISGFDNPWRGTLRQHLGKYLGTYLVKNIFTYGWVAGLEQYEFARRMGFKGEHIYPYLLCADLAKFQNMREKVESQKTISYPKVLLYAGRLLPVKGIRDLYEVFKGLTNSERNGWTLRIVGEGELKEALPADNGIEVSGFIQPDFLPKVIEKAGAFCMPSRDDHWGVAVQEFAAGGLPLITSDMVSSATAFLIPGYNGFQFEAGNKKSLKEALIKLFSLSDSELLSMGEKSFELSNKIKPEYWVQTLYHMINDGKEHSDDGNE